MKPNDGKGETPNRDSKGRFFPPGQMDARQTMTRRWMEEEEKLAKIYAQVCEQIGHFMSQPKNPVKHVPSDEAERRADDFSEKWGFGRAYKDYKRFKGGFSL